MSKLFRMALENINKYSVTNIAIEDNDGKKIFFISVLIGIFIGVII